MVRSRPHLPAGHGEVLTRPDAGEWPELVARNRAEAEAWEFRVSGVPAGQLRASARRDALDAATAFSGRLGVEVAAPEPADRPVVATGHQPELYHPGVWVKDFLVESAASRVGGTALDIVVDTDGFDAVELTAPCLAPEVRRCRQYLAVGGEGAAYLTAPVPSESDIADFCSAGEQMVATLPAPAIMRHFSEFCGALRSAAHDADNLGELVTFARRRYESSAGTSYLELPVSHLARSASFRTLVAHLIRDAERFAADYNRELSLYREATRTRSSAQPFPDLAIERDLVELPFWLIDASGRRSLSARRGGARTVELHAGGELVAEIPPEDDDAIEALALVPGVVAPKAVVLTMYVRMFACDLFIHGVGGSRYDQVTDAIIRTYWGVEPPAYAVASMTMYLPVGAHLVTDEEVADATERLNRFDHNPDQMLGEVEFDSSGERLRAHELAERKRALVRAIAEPDADKKTLGAEIREVNAALAEALRPVRDELADEKTRLEQRRAEAEVFTDRSYPFVFWAPAEIADKVR